MLIRVQFSTTDQSFKTSFNATEQGITPGFDAFQKVTEMKDAEKYTGPYEVTPTVEGEVLPTASKLMTQDLTIKAIPVYSVSNTAGGNTFYIATMDDELAGGTAILGKAKLGKMVLGKGRE